MINSSELIQSMAAAAESGEWLMLDGMVAQLPRSPDAEIVTSILCLLRDDSVGTGVMFGLVHAAEAADASVYMQGMLDALPDLYSRSVEWSEIVLMRVLNSDSDLGCMLNALAKATTSQRSVVTALLCQIEKEGSDLAGPGQLVREVLS
jgi:hypothetical protein